MSGRGERPAGRAEPVQIREIASVKGFTGCVNLQKVAFAYPDIEVVPKNELMAASECGGIVLGAYAGGALVGFVFGLAGFRREGTRWQRYHASRMVAVHPAHRNRGIARRLKMAQRRRCLDQGIDRMEWTYDPLQGANAHLNIHILGARGCAYFIDCYGPSPSPLHGGTDTDRLLVEWPLRRTRPRRAANRPLGARPIASVIPGPGGLPGPGSLALLPGLLAPRLLSFPVPRDSRALLADPRAFRAWRVFARRALFPWIDCGFQVIDFVPGETPATSSYILRRPAR